MGDETYRQLLNQYHRSILPRRHPATRTIERVGGRLFAAAGRFATEHHLEDSFDVARGVTFTVVDSKEANAFVLPGNHVFVTTGMFRHATTDDELGGVLGHELAHNLARHQGEQISGGLVVALLGYASLLIDPSGSLLTLFLPAAKLFGQLPNSRLHETEADKIGMLLAARACYDPGALIRVFGRMEQAHHRHNQQRQQPPEFLSTHPSDASRIRTMKEWLPEPRRLAEREGCVALRNQIDAATALYRNEKRTIP
jgi:predicted Zn-dependent protease